LHLPEFCWRAVIHSTLRTDGIIVLPPAVEFLWGIGDRVQQRFVETFIAEPPLERFHIRIIGRRPRANKMGVDVLLRSPLSEGFTDKLRSIIHADHLGTPVLCGQPGEDVHDTLTGEGDICLNRQTFAAEGVCDGQEPQPSPGDQTLNEKVHRPVPIYTGRSTEGQRTTLPLRPFPIAAWER